MKNFKKLYLHNSVFRFMISYATVLIVPLMVCLLSYQITFNTVREEIKQNNLTMLTRSKELIDEQVQSLRRLMLQSADNRRILAFVKEDIGNDAPNKYFAKANAAISEMGYIFKYANANIFDDVYVYVNKSDYIITRYDLYKTDLYYQMVLKEKQVSYENWLEQMMDKEQYQKFIATDSKIKVIQKVPSNINREAQGAVVCSMSKSKIKAYFENLQLEEGASLYISDRDGNILFDMTEDRVEAPKLSEVEKKQQVLSKKIDGVRNTILTVNSNETGWQYTVVIPDKIIMQRLTSLKTIISLLFILAVGVGIALSYLMSKRSGEPIEDIKKKLKDMKEGDAIDEINSTSGLSGTLVQIVSQKQLLANELEVQKPYLEAVLFQKLIKGEFSNERELKYICQRTQIDLTAESYWVLNTRFFGNNDMFNLDEQTLEDVNLLKILLKEKIQNIISEKVFFYDLDQLTITIILPKVESTYEVLRKNIKEINDQMLSEYQVTPYWGISDECRSLRQLWRAFEQSKSALKSGIKEGENTLVEYSNSVVEQDTYYYPQILEKQLITATKEGDAETIKKLLEMVYVENFENRSLQEDMIDKLYTAIKGTILKLTKQDDTRFYVESIGKYMESKTSEDIKKCFFKMTDLYMGISSTFSQEKKQQQSKLIHKITNYINEHYNNANLGLGMIATNFNISEGYVSSLFKEQTGVNFTEYVESQRINKACELLKTTDISISDIGTQVGYNSVQSFRRAFKRIHGVSPSELRK